MSRLVEEIHQFRILQHYSTVRHEQTHKTKLKDSRNAYNDNLNYLPQVITFHRGIRCFTIRDLNLQAIAHSLENSAAALQVLSSSADLPAPLSSQSYAKPEFMGPQNCRAGKHPDTMIIHFRELLSNTPDATHCVAIYSGTEEFIMHKSGTKAYVSNEQLHTMELCICDGIRVQVEGLDGECISQMCRCTGSQNWCGGDGWNDWMWVKHRPGRCNGPLNGSLSWPLQRLFIIKHLNDDGAFVEYWLALALTTIPENSGILDPVRKYVQVRIALAAVALQVFSLPNIVGCMHVIPQIGSSSRTGDERSE